MDSEGEFPLGGDELGALEGEKYRAFLLRLRELFLEIEGAGGRTMIIETEFALMQLQISIQIGCNCI